jgi:2-phospho-L-lactate guanylyltransferase
MSTPGEPRGTAATNPFGSAIDICMPADAASQGTTIATTGPVPTHPFRDRAPAPARDPARADRSGSVVTSVSCIGWKAVRVPHVTGSLRLRLVRAIVLPVKSLEEAKTRLDPVLAPLERAALTLAMLEDVLDATLSLPGWETWVISPDESVLEVAARRGARPITEDSPPLASALRQVEDEAVGRGMDALAVLLPDTPLVTPMALMRALHTLGPVVVAPSLDETGTNLLLRRPPGVIGSRFGPQSYRNHLQEAAEADVPVSVVESQELGFDLDVPDDILTVLHARRAGRTREVLRALDLPDPSSTPSGRI